MQLYPITFVDLHPAIDHCAEKQQVSRCVNERHCLLDIIFGVYLMVGAKEHIRLLEDRSQETEVRIILFFRLLSPDFQQKSPLIGGLFY